MSGTFLSTRDMAVTNSDKNLCLHGTSNTVRRQDSNLIIKKGIERMSQEVCHLQDGSREDLIKNYIEHMKLKTRLPSCNRAFP